LDFREGIGTAMARIRGMEFRTCSSSFTSASLLGCGKPHNLVATVCPGKKEIL
jgi:hypothetical protein